MRSAFRGSRNSALICLLAAVATFALLPAYGVSVQIDLDDDPSNGDESTVETKVLQSFPVKIENVIVNNTSGASFTFNWLGAGPGGFSSILTPGPDVGTKWAWSTVSQVYSISTNGSFVEDARGIPVFGSPPGGFVSPGGNARLFALPGKSIFPNQATASTASLTASLITFFSPENTVATCESTYTPGVFTQTITNTSGEPLSLLVEQEDCCLEPHQIICGETCQSYLTDETNCGDCGVTCAYDEFCDGGACAAICPGVGEELCDGECADTLNDDTNCGDCGITCAYDEFCDGGACAAICPGVGQEYCDEECADTLNDDTNCGDCGVTCAYDEFCNGGGCAPICPGEAQEYCDGECADTLTDDTNCGACGVTCAYDELCDGGACAPICPGEAQEYCDGECADTLNDPMNCGDCGQACLYDEFCDAGACTPICSEGMTLCGTVCVDLQSDPLHCGECGSTCGSNDICEAATCETCRPPQGTACDNECVNTHTDPYNCGGCGNVCDFSDCPSSGQGACSQGSSCICDPAGTASEPIYFDPIFTDPPVSAIRLPAPRHGRTSTATLPLTQPQSLPGSKRERASTATWPVAQPQALPAQVQNAGQATATPRPQTTGSRRGPAERYLARNEKRRSSVGEEPKSNHPREQRASTVSATVDEAPVCEFQDPIEQIIPDGESYTQCQTGAVLGTEVFTRTSVVRDGELVGVGPCAVFVPATDIIVDDFYAMTSAVILQDASGDGLLQPGEQADLHISLLNVGPLELMNAVATLSGPPDQFNPTEITVITDTAFFPDFPPFATVADCETPPVLEPQMALTPFTIVLPEEQEPDVGRALHLTIHGDNVGPVVFEMPLILGIGEKCDPTELNGETYDGLNGFLPPLNTRLVPRGTQVNYSDTQLVSGDLVSLRLQLKCGTQILQPHEIDPKPRIESIVHETLGPLPLELINVGVGPFPLIPYFHCGELQCHFNMNSSNLPVGTYVIGVGMADTRVFEAGFTLVQFEDPAGE